MRFLKALTTVVPFRWLRSRTSRSLAWEEHFRAAQDALQDGRIGQTETCLRAALCEADGFAADDPRTQATLDALIRLNLSAGRPQHALELSQRALALRERLWGAGSPRLATTLADLAQAHADLGRHAVAAQIRARVLSILATRIGPELPELLESLDNSPLLGGSDPPRDKQRS